MFRFKNLVAANHFLLFKNFAREIVFLLISSRLPFLAFPNAKITALLKKNYKTNTTKPRTRNGSETLQRHTFVIICQPKQRYIQSAQAEPLGLSPRQALIHAERLFSSAICHFLVALLDCFITIKLVYFNRIFINVLRKTCNPSIFFCCLQLRSVSC